jgi:DNA-binding transcriptional LysR family regulator
MKLTHRQIEVFRTVMQTGQVTRAAERLHTSQPTVSRELARLEQVTGLHLFDRVRGRLQPTARALALLEEVDLSYVGLERIAATAVGLRSWAQGRLQVACLPALAHALLPDGLKRLAAQVPDAAVGLTPLDSPQLEAALSEQRFDLGLSERLEAPPACSLEHLLVADEVAVLPAGHRLAGRALLSAGDFEGEAFIGLAPGDPYRQQVDDWFAKAGVSRVLRLVASVQLFRQLHGANALVVALDGGCLLALALGGGLFVELAGAQVGQQAQFFDGAFEAAQSDVEGFVVFYTDGRH